MQVPIIQEQVVQLCRELISDPIIRETPCFRDRDQCAWDCGYRKRYYPRFFEQMRLQISLSDILKGIFELPVFIEHDTLSLQSQKNFMVLGVVWGHDLYHRIHRYRSLFDCQP